MAADEVLMEWSATTGECCWRFYAWEEPTLSLGYFQAYEDRHGHAASVACPAVRRMSGGGAILHDAELTYSFVLPRNHPLAARRLVLYRAIHTTLIEVLSDYGIVASLNERSGATRPGQQPFLCFQRRAPGDVLVGPTKIAGSAQRRSLGAMLQHGSVLIARSPAAPELDGLNNLAETPISQSLLVEAWLDRLAQQLSLIWHNEPLCGPEPQRVAQLAEAKYASEAWTVHRRR